MSVDRDPNDNGGTELSEVTPEEETKNDNTSDEYQDYYEHVAKSKYIRPIAVTEDVNFETMSISQRLMWWISTAIRLLRYVCGWKDAPWIIEK